VEARREALAVVGGLLRACGDEYAVVPLPAPSAATASLARLSDTYDAVMGLLAARAKIERSPWSWNACVPDVAGSILTIAPPWLRAKFATLVARQA
jgi:hypothetical protein